MKKIASYLVLAGLAGGLIARAQTGTPTPSQPVVDNTNPAVATGLTTNSAPMVADTPAAEAAATTTSSNLLAAAGATNAPVPAPAGIPLIQFSDVPITTAIENLARQAGINYMLDPKIGYGQADASGQIKVEPQLSIRWENITAESALLALLDNYGLQLVVDKKTGIDRVAPKDPLAPPPLVTHVIQLQYSSVSNMTAAVQSVLTDKRSRVIPDTRTSQLLVVATDPEQESVNTLVAQLDKQTKQVLIETKLIEISSAPSAKRGVDWSSTLSAQKVSFGNGGIIPDPSKSSTTISSSGPKYTSSSTASSSSSGSTITAPPVPPAVSSSPATTTTVGSSQSSSSGTVAPTRSQNTLLSLLQGNGGWSASTLNGLIPATGFLNADGVSAVISFLNSSFDAQIVSTPRIVTLDNETATISITRNIPVVSVTPGTQNSGGTASITYSNVGTILEVTPRISANDNIWLKVVPEISSKFGDVNVTIAGGNGNASTIIPVPEFDSRRIESQVLIPNGNTLVMGGLVSDHPTASYTKVPFLGDIPGLGWLFHSEDKSMSKDSLIIFICPTIVRDNDFAPTPTTFLQSKPRIMKSPMNPHMPWDGSNPERGWDNPAPVPGEFDKIKNTR